MFCAGAGDRAVDYLHIPKNIDAGCAAHGVQAAGAGNGQIPVHVNAVCKRIISNGGIAHQIKGQAATGIDAAGCLPIYFISFCDSRIPQRQGIGGGVVGDGTVPQHVAGVPPGDQRAAHPDIILLSRAGRRIGSGIRNGFGDQVMAQPRRHLIGKGATYCSAARCVAGGDTVAQGQMGRGCRQRRPRQQAQAQGQGQADTQHSSFHLVPPPTSKSIPKSIGMGLYTGEGHVPSPCALYSFQVYQKAEAGAIGHFRG